MSLIKSHKYLLMLMNYLLLEHLTMSDVMLRISISRLLFARLNMGIVMDMMSILKEEEKEAIT